MRKVMRIVRFAMLGLLAAFALIQLVPYGRSHTNPPVTREPTWDQPSTRQLAARACFDCHSNETRWPWYANVAPTSWLVQGHVNEGRRALNFSEWQRAYEEAGEAGESVLEGDMPPRSYLLLHPAAVLSADEKRALAAGLDASLGGRHPKHEHEHDD
jgi:mono/diheme cytochrome c family protein